MNRTFCRDVISPVISQRRRALAPGGLSSLDVSAVPSDNTDRYIYIYIREPPRARLTRSIPRTSSRSRVSPGGWGCWRRPAAAACSPRVAWRPCPGAAGSSSLARPAIGTAAAPRSSPGSSACYRRRRRFRLFGYERFSRPLLCPASPPSLPNIRGATSGGDESLDSDRRRAEYIFARRRREDPVSTGVCIRYSYIRKYIRWFNVRI